MLQFVKYTKWIIIASNLNKYFITIFEPYMMPIYLYLTVSCEEKQITHVKRHVLA